MIGYASAATRSYRAQSTKLAVQRSSADGTDLNRTTDLKSLLVH